MSRRRRVAVALGAALLAVLPVVAPMGSTPAAADTAAVIPGASALGNTVAYPDVAAGSGGVYHGVVMDSTLGSRILYVRSTDAGRTWAKVAILSGSIGATRPAVAADGKHVAVAFIGAWTDADGVHGEAPYLTTSSDGGNSWTPARRLGTWATDVDVAVDGERTWVIWGGTGGIRGTTDGGETFFVSRALTGVASARIAAEGGVVSAAYWDGGNDMGNTYVAVGQGENLGAFSKVEHANLRDVAAGDGLGYALVTDGTDYSVLSSSPGGSPSRVHVPSPEGGWPGGDFTTASAGIAASRGQVTFATCQAGSVWVSQSTDWPTFGEPAATTTFDDAIGSPCRLTVSAAAGGSDPQPRFDWSVAPHYTDTNGDGLPEPANASGTPADNVIVGDNAVLEVTLDGCASLASSGGAFITHYVWSVNGTQVADLDHCQGPTIEVHSGDTPTVRLEVRDDHAGRAVTSREIAPKDLVVVSLGDSVASGEGSPLRDQSGTAEVAWTDRSCHSSPYAGPALAAKQLEDADPHTAVTFVQLACSGAAIVDTFDDPSHRKGPGDADDPSTGGVKDAYAGVEHAKTCDSPGTPCPSLRPSQLTQMQQLLGPRAADAVLISVGANDVRFSGTLKSCLLPPIALPGLINGCNDGAAAAEHDSRMDELPARYQQLANGFDAAGVDPATVHITEYFDPTGDKYGVANLRCVGKPEGLPALDVPTAGLWALASNVDLITDSEAIWARNHVVAGLNGAVRDAASGHGWDYVGGITSRFATHGYCSDEPWIVRLGESVTKQHDEFGAFHPNKAGQEVYGDALYTHLAPLVQVPPTKVTDAAPGGSASVGDVVVLASDVWAVHPELRSVTLTTTGGQPLVGAVRRLQSGSGWGEVATDGKSAVGVWAGEHGGFAAQIASRPNATVNAVSVVQASDDASRLVTNRKTAVHATLSLAGAGARTTAVTTTVTAHGDLGDTLVFGPTTEQVLLQPGVNDVLLPVDEVLEAPPGATLVATVKVDDPPGAAEGDDVDNELSTSTGAFAPTIDTRPLKVVFVPLDFGSATVTCGDIATQANIWVAWAQQLLPVPDSGVQANLSCTPELLATSASADGVAQALGELDLLARESGVDSVVGIAPHGWLGNALGDSSVARASVTGRSIMIDSGAPQATLAHELGHNLGLEHSELPPATGAWVSRNRIMHGPDFMSAVTDGTTQEWVSGETWDLLTGAIAEGSAPQQPEPGGSAFWVRGVMPLSGDSLSLDPFIDDGNIPSPPPDGSDVSRLVVVPLAGDGTPSGAAVQVGLTRDEGLGGDEGATLRFAQKVVAPAGTVKFRFIVDETTVAERTLGSAPTISLTLPTAGTSLSRADTIHVAWTVSDPDTSDDVPAPTVNVLVSDDGGATWRPLASGFTGSSADVAVPRDLGGDAIVVRAVASDGVHLRWADSGTFSIDPAPKLTSDRIAFVSGDPDVGRQGTGGWAGIRPTWDRIGTMKPDGTDVRFFAVPTDDEDPPGWTMPASYSSPTFGPDGRIYFRKGNGRVVSTEADGTDLRNETTSTSAYGAFSTDANRRGCLSMSADGSRMLVDLTVFERSGSGWTPIAGLEMFQNFWGPAPGNWNGLFPFSGAPIMKSDQCPVLSPDGKHVARAFSVEAETMAPGVAVVTVDPGATDFLQWRFVTEAADSTRMSASWLDNHDLLVTRGKAGTDQATLQRVDIGNIPATDTSGERPVLYPAAATNLGTITWPQSTAHDRAPKLLSDGRYYGDAQCALFVAGTSTTVVPSGYVPGSSTCFTQFAWDDDAGSTGGGGDTMLGLDPSQAPDPAAPGPADPALVEEGPPAPGAGTDASHPTPDSVGPSSFTIAPGQTADLVLSNNLGALVRYEVDPNVVQPPGGGTVTATGDVDGATGLITTSGPVTVSADAATADATGPARIRVRAVGANSWDTIEINIATPLRPSASDDELVVQAGVEATFPESALLDNDSPARPGAELSVIQLSGYDRGSAFLDADGVVHVVASAAGTGTFTYAVAEDGSTAYSTATVTVSAADTPVPVLSISLSSAKVHRGDTITVTGSGFAADEEVTAVMHSGEPFAMGTVRADSAGRIVLTWTIPQTAEIGSHRIVLTGASSGTVEGALQVVAQETQGGGDQGSGGGDLSGTGFDGAAYAAMALALLLCGAFMILIARGQRPRSPQVRADQDVAELAGGVEHRA